MRSQLPRLLHDTSPQVRILAIEKLHTLASATDMLTRCRDIDREVARAAILTVSRRWVFLDHGDRELKNLARFVGILEMHQRDERWNIGDGFLLTFHKVRIADTKLGRKLRERTNRLPTREIGLTKSEFGHGSPRLKYPQVPTVRASDAVLGGDISGTQPLPSMQRKFHFRIECLLSVGLFATKPNRRKSFHTKHPRQESNLEPAD